MKSNLVVFRVSLNLSCLAVRKIVPVLVNDMWKALFASIRPDLASKCDYLDFFQATIINLIFGWQINHAITITALEALSSGNSEKSKKKKSEKK